VNNHGLEQVAYPKQIKCPWCDGTGKIRALLSDETWECDCLGLGWFVGDETDEKWADPKNMFGFRGQSRESYRSMLEELEALKRIEEARGQP